jgi:NADH:ubiquinone oxidoreductase subunit F (NADH-binding)
MDKLLEKIKDVDLRSWNVNDYPIGQQWLKFSKQKAGKTYIICNAAEEEPGIFESAYLFETKLKDVIAGITLALDIFLQSTAYIYLSEDLYENFKEELNKLIENKPITVFIKNPCYLCGEEESTIISDIEATNHPPMPFHRDDSISDNGLYGYPTLINTPEIFYRINQLAQNKYEGMKLFSVSGDVKEMGVSELPDDLSIEKVMKELNIYPKKDFFAQVGGGALGEIMLPKELDQPFKGRASVVVYDRKKTDLMALMWKWAQFFMKSNCDKCTPCREGIYRLSEMFDHNRKDKKLLQDIMMVLKESSYCSFGKRTTVPFESLLEKLLS